MLAEAQPGAPSPGGLKGFLATTPGKLVVAGAAVGLLVLVGVVVLVVVLIGSSKPEVTIAPQAQPASQSATGTVPGSSDATVVPPAVPDSEVFTFRDVFKPLIRTVVPAGSTPPGSTTTSSTAGETDTLYLQDVVVEGDKDKAVLTYNGTAYTLGEGEVVTGTPWKVLSIDASGDSVVMLYGDSQVTLTVGEGTASGK